VIAWELWDTSTIAERFKLTRKYVEERVVSQPTFPPPIPLTDGGRPRWIASEVISWVESRRQAA
jgi:predicted DNA-binding transcriptional regulator AlpA